MIQTIYVLSILLFTVGFSVITECLRRRGAKLDRLFKAVGLVLAAVAFAAYMKAEPAIYDVQGRDMFSPFGSDTAKTVLSILIYWFPHSATLVAILSVFFIYEYLKTLSRLFA